MADIDDISPAQLRALADRLEAEAVTASEQREAERLQAAVDAGNDALAERIIDRLSERLDVRVQELLDRRLAPGDEGEADENKDDGGGGDEEGEAGEEDEPGEHADILPGRWRARKVFGARLYSGAPEPETVRFRNEKGQLQSRPGRVSGKPYQTEWEPVEDVAEDGNTEEDAA